MRVCRLIYDLVTSTGVHGSPPPLDVELEGFRGRLSDGRLNLVAVAEWSHLEAAREALEPQLRAWELSALLERGAHVVEFRFAAGHLEEVTPDRRDATISVSGLGVSVGMASLQVVLGRYPEPPRAAGWNADVEAIARRYRAIVEGREPILAGGYAMLTALEVLAGDENRITEMFGISRRVLTRLGVITSRRGDMSTARKVQKDLQPLDPAEKAWLERVLPAIVRRVSQRAAGVVPTQLTLGDLPPLP